MTLDVGADWQSCQFEDLGGLLVRRIAAAQRLKWAASDYCRTAINQVTSTPHQPANACFAPSLLPNVAQIDPLEAWKLRGIKGLPRKALKYLGYRNRWGFGS